MTKKVLKLPALETLILKSRHQQAFSQHSSEETTILFMNQGILISSSDESVVRQLFELFAEKQRKFVYLRVSLIKPSSRCSFSQSPRISKDMYSNNCKISLINDQIYVSSFDKSLKQIEQIISKYSGQDIWTLPFKNPKHENPLYYQIAEYFQNLFLHKKQNLSKFNVIIEINHDKSHFLIWGGSENNKMEVKDLLRQFAYSTTLLQIRSKFNINQVKKYLKEKCEHPVVLNQYEEGVYRFVTKDSVMLRLLNSDKFMDMICLKDSEIGLFLFEDKQYGYKRTIIQNLARQKKFFIEDRYSFLYFKNCLNLKDSPRIEATVDILQIVLKELIQNKQDSQTKKRNKMRLEKREREKEKQNRIKEQFSSFGQKQQFSKSKEFCEMFGCDVIVQKVYLNAKYLDRYEQFEGQSTLDNQFFSFIDWCPPCETEIISIKRGKMKGKYYYGQIKQSGEGKMFLPRLLISVFEGS